MFEAIDRSSEAALWDRIDLDRVDAHLDAFEGLDRVSGTTAEREAAEYVMETLSEYGVEATFHEYETLISTPGSAAVEVTTPDEYRIDECITTAFSASTPAAGVHAPVRHVEDPHAVTDLEGEIAFAAGLPTPDQIQALEAAGATAAIYESPTEGHLHEMIASPVWGTPSTETADALPDLPIVEIGQTDADGLRDRLREGPVEATVRTQVTTRLETLPNPVGRIEGDRDRYLIVGNHIDSWHEGITDNATAVATTLELARLFADEDLTRGLVLGFWTAHSTGRYAGSAWYADSHWADLRANAVGYVHLDLNGLRGADTLWYQHMAEVGAEHEDVLETASAFELKNGGESFLGGDHRPGRNSDQSFWGVGASSLLSGARLEPGTEEGGPVGGGWWWHTPEDTRDKVDLEVLGEELRVYVALASRFVHSPILPHDFTATVTDLRETLSGIEADTAVEFDGIRAAADRLEAALEEAHAGFGAAAEDRAVAAAIEDLQVELGNELVPALYMRRGDHEQDPGLPQGRLPGLRQAAGTHADATGRERRFAETSLQRERNRVRHRLDRAARRVERFAATHAG